MVEVVIPKRGDIIWITEQPDTEFARALRVPVVVVSPARYNETTGLAIVCPITSPATGSPHEVRIPPGIVVTGLILADQPRSADWRSSDASIATRLPQGTVDAVLSVLGQLLVER